MLALWEPGSTGWSKSYLEGSRYGRACILWCEDNTGELICIQCQRLRFLHKMRCKEYVSMKKIGILLLINLIMERFLKVALELLKQFFIAIVKLESGFIKFLLNQATIWRNKFPELVRTELCGGHVRIFFQPM